MFMFITFLKREYMFSELYLPSPLQILNKCDKTGKQSCFTCKKFFSFFKHIQLTLQHKKLNKFLEVFFNLH